MNNSEKDTLVEAFTSMYPEEKNLSEMEILNLVQERKDDSAFKACLEEVDLLNQWGQRQRSLEAIREMDPHFEVPKQVKKRRSVPWSLAAGIALMITIAWSFFGDSFTTTINPGIGEEAICIVDTLPETPTSLDEMIDSVPLIAVIESNSDTWDGESLNPNVPEQLNPSEKTKAKRTDPEPLPGLVEKERQVVFRPKVRNESIWERGKSSFHLGTWLEDLEFVLPPSIPSRFLRRVTRANTRAVLPFPDPNHPERESVLIQVLVFEDRLLKKPKYCFRDQLILFVQERNEAVNMDRLGLKTQGSEEGFLLTLDGIAYLISRQLPGEGIRILE